MLFHYSQFSKGYVLVVRYHMQLAFWMMASDSPILPTVIYRNYFKVRNKENFIKHHIWKHIGFGDSSYITKIRCDDAKETIA